MSNLETMIYTEDIENIISSVMNTVSKYNYDKRDNSCEIIFEYGIAIIRLVSIDHLVYIDRYSFESDQEPDLYFLYINNISFPEFSNWIRMLCV